MKLVKRILIAFMVVFLLSANLSYVKGASNLTQNDKANILNSLTILKGNGSDYGLNSQLKRSEAAAFIVRLLGQEATVLKEKTKYAYTSYTDVSPDEWYAPYVGYCDKNGIINGYADKTFKPNAYLSEKSFLKMVLATLGYRYGVDYTWSSVFYLAYEAGIVTDTSYKTKSTDNTQYKRGNVVDVLFEALQKETKDTKVKLIQSFINASIITKDQAIQYGLIQDDVQTSLDTVTPVSEYAIEISFNEALKDFIKEQVLVYESDDTAAVLKVKEITKMTGTAKYKVTFETKQKPDKDYVLLVSSVKDSYGNESNGFNKTFIGYRPAVITSDYFMISKVEPISENVVNVYYTQPINDNVLQPSYYTTKKAGATVVAGSSQEITVSRIANSDKGVSIYYKNYKFTEEYYELVIDGKMTSAYSVQLNDGKGDSVKFKASKATNEAFSLTGFSTLSANTLQLDFNKVINPVIAKQIFSYYLTSAAGTPMAITKAEVIEETGKSVRLTTSGTFIKGQKYNIMINNLTDSTRLYSITEKQYEVTCAFTTLPDVKISNVFALDAYTVLLYVDRPLDYDMATLPSNFQIYGVTNTSFLTIPAAIYYDKINNPLVVKLYLPEGKGLEANKSYDFRMMPTVKDTQGNIQSTTVHYSFNSGDNQYVNTYISDAKIIGENTIKLSFIKEIAVDVPNVLNTNYSLTYVEDGVTYKKIPTSAIYIDPTTMILKFDSLDLTKTYTVLFNKLVNYGNMTTDNAQGKYLQTVVKGQ